MCAGHTCVCLCLLGGDNLELLGAATASSVKSSTTLPSSPLPVTTQLATRRAKGLYAVARDGMRLWELAAKHLLSPGDGMRLWELAARSLPVPSEVPPAARRSQPEQAIEKQIVQHAFQG